MHIIKEYLIIKSKITIKTTNITKLLDSIIKNLNNYYLSGVNCLNIFNCLNMKANKYKR